MSLQQLHMFCPDSVELVSLVPHLCKLLASHHLVLRRSAVSCLRQFAQREAVEICGYASSLDFSEAEASVENNTSDDPDNEGLVTMRLNYQSGLPGMLFSLLDYESDHGQTSDIHDTLTSIMQGMAANNLTSWLALCREILSVSAEDSAGSGGPKNMKDLGGGGSGGGGDDDDEERDASDDVKFTTNADDPEAARRALMIPPRWSTRVFAALCLRKIIDG